MASNLRLFKACVMSLALLFACGASAQTTTANEEPRAASPALQDPAPREAPAVADPAPLAEPPAPPIATVPEPSLERAAAEPAAKPLQKKRAEAAPKKAEVPAIAPVPETAAIPPRPVSEPSASLTQLSPATGQVSSATPSPAQAHPALPSHQEDATASTGFTYFRFLWAVMLLALAAGLACLGWKVFKYSAWHFPPGY